MVVLLPFDDNGLEALEKKMSADVLLKAVQDTRKVKVEVMLPKFKVRRGLLVRNACRNNSYNL